MILRTCGNWALSSGGDGGRCALYWSYSRWRKVGARHVERDGAVSRFAVGDLAEEGVEEAVHAVDVFAGAAHVQGRPDGVPRAVDHRVTVHQDE